MGNNCGMDSRRILAPSGLTKPENINFLVIFSIFHFWGWCPRKVDDLLTSPINQFRDYFIRNSIEKLVPLNYRFPTDNKKTSKTIDQTVFKLDFWPKSGFPKTRDLSPVAPRGVYISRNDSKKKEMLEMSENIKNRHLLTKWLPFLCIFIVLVFFVWHRAVF